MKLASKMHTVLSILGVLAALLVYAFALVAQVLLLVANIVVLAALGAIICAVLYIFYKASGDSLYVPAVLALVVGAAVSYAVYDHRHGWRPVYL